MDQADYAVLREDLWRTLDHIGEWVRFADTKAAGAVTADGILATILVTKFAAGLGQHHWLIIPLVMAGVSLTASVAFALLTLIPRLKIGDPNTVIYFTGVAASPTAEDYQTRLTAALGSGCFPDDLSREVWSRAKAATVKYRHARHAILGLVGALVASFAIGVDLVLH